MRRADAEDNELELELMPDGNDGVDAATVEAESGTWGGTNGWRSKSKSRHCCEKSLAWRGGSGGCKNKR